MTEQILLNNISIPGAGSRTYALVENNNPYHDLSLKPGDKDLLLKQSYGDRISSFADREKIYFKDGRILRAKGTSYTSVMPKNATGKFEVFDGDLVIEGKLQEGKISEITSFLKRNQKNVAGGNVSLDYGVTNLTRKNIERLLKSTQDGTLKLQNLTKVILKKYLAFLPK